MRQGVHVTKFDGGVFKAVDTGTILSLWRVQKKATRKQGEFRKTNLALAFLQPSFLRFEVVHNSLLALFDQNERRQLEPLFAVEPRRPPKTNVGTKTAFRHDQCKQFKKNKHLLRSEVSWYESNSRTFSTFRLYIDLHAQRHGFRPKRKHFRGQSSSRR